MQVEEEEVGEDLGGGEQLGAGGGDVDTDSGWISLVSASYD